MKKVKQSGRKTNTELATLQKRIEKLEETGVRQLEKRQKLVIQLLEVLNRPGDKKDLIHNLLLLIKEHTGLECVAIRLKEDDDYPYYVTNGFPDDFVEAERYLCARDNDGQPLKDARGNPVLECMCGNIIQGRTDPKFPFFTERGSFWSNSTTKLLASTTESERQARTRNRCNAEGYESVALIPLRINGDTIGLLQLNDSRPDMFTPEMITFFERIGASIGIAFKRTKIEEDRYRTTLDNMLEGCQIIGSDWKYLYVNDAAVKHGKQTKGQLIGRTMMECYPGIEKTELFAILRSCLKERIAHHLENKFTFPDGSEGWFDLSIQPVPEGVFILSLDITERRQNEEKISHLNNVLRAVRNVNQLITRERDRGKLLKEACDKLIETRGYHSAWIAAFDKSGKLLTAAEAGLGAHFLPILEEMEKGHLPPCAQQALKQEEIVLIADSPSYCRDCSLLKRDPGKENMAVRLEYHGRIFGILVVGYPPAIVMDKEELGLFREVTGDIAFALHSMELTEQHNQAEKELTKLSSVVEQTADLVIMTDKEGVIQYANPAFRKLTGYTRDDVQDKTPRLLKSGAHDTGFYENLWKTIRSGNVFRAELTNRKKNGEIYYEEKTITPVKDSQGRITHFVSIGKDITEHKKAEEVLVASETRYRRLFEAARDGIIILDAGTGQIVDVNKFLIDLLGFSHAQFLGKKIWEIGLFKDVVSNKENFSELQRKEHIRYENMPLETAAGKKIDVEFVSNVYLVDRQKVIQCNIRDITERRKIEAQLFQAQKLESVGTLVGGIAHDFNNILSVIDGYSSMILADLEPENPLRRDIGEIRTAGARANTLIRQLLAFSRKQVTQPEAVNLNTTVTEMEKMLQRLISKDIKLVNILASKLAPVKVDPGQIEQVLMNLVINARDAMPEGGTLTLKTEEVVIDESYARTNPDVRPGRFIQLSVQDTGLGMTKEIIAHIFEPFFTTKPVGKGSGLGLSVVYGIVKQHQGWINVYSEVGKGTIFKIYLPVLAETAERKKKTEIIAVAKIKGKGERILIVEDDEAVRRFAQRALEENGYTVFPAESPAAAWNTFEKEKGRFHLIFSDVILPDKTGLQLVEEFFAYKPDLKVVFASGYVDEKSRWETIRDKGYKFLQKPYGLNELLKAVREVIG